MSRDQSPVRKSSKEELPLSAEPEALYVPDEKTLKKIRRHQARRSNQVDLTTCDSTIENLNLYIEEQKKQSMYEKEAKAALEKLNFEIGKLLPILCKGGSFTLPMLNGKNPLTKRMIHHSSWLFSGDVCDFENSTFQ